MQASRSETVYKNMLNDIGDIFEAVSTIASSQTPNADPVRKHLQMLKVHADRIAACLGAMSEYANLLLRSCGLSEVDVFEELKVTHMGAKVELQRNSVHGRVATTLKRPFAAVAPDLASKEVPPAVRPRSSAASSSSGSVSRLPLDVFDTRFSPDKKSKFFLCDRCGARMSNNGQGLSHLGDWVESKRGLPIIEYERRWQAGENFTWYCLGCLCKHAGYKDDNKSKWKVLEARGLLEHAQNRQRRLQEHNRKIAETQPRRKRKY